VEEGEMQLSQVGMIADRYWLEIPDHFPFVKLGNHVVMPNHVHGIIIIDKDPGVGDDDQIGNIQDSGGAINRATTVGENMFADPPTPKPGGITGNKNPMLYHNLSRILRWYKGRVTFESRKLDSDFRWQSRFYEHIIRNPWAYRSILRYIADNPKNWNEDLFF
jgi:REP element-mobilizing transposase RayT